MARSSCVLQTVGLSKFARALRIAGPNLYWDTRFRPLPRTQTAKSQAKARTISLSLPAIISIPMESFSSTSTSLSAANEAKILQPMQLVARDGHGSAIPPPPLALPNPFSSWLNVLHAEHSAFVYGGGDAVDGLYAKASVDFIKLSLQNPHLGLNPGLSFEKRLG